MGMIVDSVKEVGSISSSKSKLDTKYEKSQKITSNFYKNNPLQQKVVKNAERLPSIFHDESIQAGICVSPYKKT